MFNKLIKYIIILLGFVLLFTLFILGEGMSAPINNGKNKNWNIPETNSSSKLGSGSESVKRGRYSVPKKAVAPKSTNENDPPLPWGLRGKTSGNADADMGSRAPSLREKKVVHYTKSEKKKRLSPLKSSDDSSYSSQDTSQVLKITTVRNNLRLINPHYNGRNQIGDENCLPCVISFYNWVSSGEAEPAEVDVDAKPQKEHMFHVTDKISLLQDIHVKNLNNRKEPLKVDEEVLKWIDNHDEALAFKPIEFRDLEKHINRMPWQRKNETDFYKSGIIFLNKYVEDEDKTEEEMNVEFDIDAHYLNFYCYKVNDKESKIYIIDPQKCEIHDIEGFKEKCADKYEDDIKVWSESDSTFVTQKFESEPTFSKRKRNDDGEILSVIEIPKSPKKQKHSKSNSSEAAESTQQVHVPRAIRPPQLSTQPYFSRQPYLPHLYREQEVDSPEKIFSVIRHGTEFRVAHFSYAYVPALLQLFQESLINRYELVSLLSVKDLEGYTALENNVIWKKNLSSLRNLDLDILADILAIEGKDNKILFSKELIRSDVLFDFIRHEYYVDPLFTIIENYRK